MSTEGASAPFLLSKINLQKEKTQQEQFFLNKFSNVLDYTNLLDEKKNDFYDTINFYGQALPAAAAGMPGRMATAA